MENKIKKCKLCGNEDEVQLIVDKSTDGKHEDGYKCIECLMNEKNIKNKKPSIIENMEQICKNCSHTKSDHYGIILDPYKNKENERKARAGVCGKPDCPCENFEPIE